MAAAASLVGPGEELAVPPVGELEADGPATLGAASVFAAQPTVAAAMAAVTSRRAVRISPSTVRGAGRFPEAHNRASGNRGVVRAGAAVSSRCRGRGWRRTGSRRGRHGGRTPWSAAARPAPPTGGPTRRHLIVSGSARSVGDEDAEVGADDELVADHDHVGGGNVGEADGQVGPGDGHAGRGLGELAAVDVLDAGAGAFDEPPVEPVEDQVDRRVGRVATGRR